MGDTYNSAAEAETDRARQKLRSTRVDLEPIVIMGPTQILELLPCFHRQTGPQRPWPRGTARSHRAPARATQPPWLKSELRPTVMRRMCCRSSTTSDPPASPVCAALQLSSTPGASSQRAKGNGTQRPSAICSAARVACCEGRRGDRGAWRIGHMITATRRNGLRTYATVAFESIRLGAGRFALRGLYNVKGVEHAVQGWRYI
jgi:hypothetical protein